MFILSSEAVVSNSDNLFGAKILIGLRAPLSHVVVRSLAALGRGWMAIRGTADAATVLPHARNQQATG